MPSIAKITELLSKARAAHASRNRMEKAANWLLLAMIILTIASPAVYVRCQPLGVGIALVNVILAVVAFILAVMVPMRKWRGDDAEETANAQAKELLGSPTQRTEGQEDPF